MIVKTKKMDSPSVQKKETTFRSPNREESKRHILLAGNPNVGKSVIFSALSGIQAESSNYAGTTVSYQSGEILIGNEHCLLTDLPGAYSLSPSCDAERVTAEMIAGGADALLCVLDATRLSHSVRFALELQKYRIPTVYLLNLTDVAERMGIVIDTKKLAERLGGRVIPCVAVRGIGLDAIRTALKELFRKQAFSCHDCHADSAVSCTPASPVRASSAPFSAQDIARESERQASPKKSVSEKLGNLMIHPFWGIPIAVVVLSLSIFLIVGCSEFTIRFFFEPLTEIFADFFRNAFSGLDPNRFLSKLLIGEYGICIISFEWILGSILPYVFFFYLVFSFLEDLGYLPRLGVLFDNLMSRMGLQGGSILPLLLGYGCAVPAIIGSRSAGSRKERVMIAAAICFAIPCTSQTGALLRLFSGKLFPAVPLLILISFLVIFLVSVLLRNVLKGEVSPMMMEIPHLLFPNPKAYFQKFLLRMKQFLWDAELPMMSAILLIAVVSSAGLLESISQWLSPLVVNWLGLPKEASLALLSGMIRREMSVAPLLGMNLTDLQLFTGGVVSLLYLPCLSTFAVLVKELGLKTALMISFGTVANAFLIGGCVHFIGKFLSL